MELSPQNIPIIDLEPDSFKDIAIHIAKACEASGCFYIKNHGIPAEVIINIQNDLRSFFGQPTEYKFGFLNSKGGNKDDRGYQPFESLNVNAFMGKFGLPNDPVERYAFGPMTKLDRPIQENIWPDQPATLKKNVEIYYEQTKHLAEKLMKIFAVAAGAPEDYIYDRCFKGEHTLKANFYPKSAVPKSNQSTRFAEHTDTPPFTILVQDHCTKALQIQNVAGEWVYADPIPGTLFVNVGDATAFWTNDKWTATVHRVNWPEKNEWKDRISLAYFVRLNPGTVVTPMPSCVKEGEQPKYGPNSYTEYVNGKMAKLATGRN